MVTHCRLKVTGSWSNHKVNMCHLPAICHGLRYVFYVVFQRLFCLQNHFSLDAAAWILKSMTNRPYAPSCFTSRWTSWWPHFSWKDMIMIQIQSQNICHKKPRSVVDFGMYSTWFFIGFFFCCTLFTSMLPLKYLKLGQTSHMPLNDIMLMNIMVHSLSVESNQSTIFTLVQNVS